MSVATITIYGRDDDPSSGAIVTATSTVETGVEDTDWWKWETEVYNVDAGVEDEFETKEYLDYFKPSINNFRMKYELQCKGVDFPTNATDITTLFPFLDVIDKKYIWLHLNDYKITCYSSQSTNAIRVAIDSTNGIENNLGQKDFNITFTELKRNRDHT